MRKITVESSLEVYSSLQELPNDIQMLMQQAIEARAKAYSPYSNFQVGAALSLDNGKIITGNNQENASYPSGLCAERTAIYYAGSQHPNSKITRMAITASSKTKVTDKPIPPCGACRQAILEYEIKQKQPIEIYFMGKVGEVAKSSSLTNLLPFIFDKEVL
ncbi:cytidine deaminase [Ichthyenterobacterium sp. W332]|uniref:Cytidine deaminase n=1 Tax=Microcosmobacter mediterraneus TaxID=3075607 RepID=A0ABU2YJU6_9FLAO|nr:cytidine deaminase [Ichthyenterobacterium sp. W332]MDT0558444.1 cytidine deaminase [Ichthyenterobacterium sp. W332]